MKNPIKENLNKLKKVNVEPNQENEFDELESTNPDFTWIPFYRELANKILEFKDKNRDNLIEKLKETIGKSKSNPMIMKDGTKVPDVDPFTIISITISKYQKPKTRKPFLQKLREALLIEEKSPTGFSGVPTRFGSLNWMVSEYSKTSSEPKPGEPKPEIKIKNLWELFELSIKLADFETSDEEKEGFNELFTRCSHFDSVGIGITTVLYLIRPERYISLDDPTINFLNNTKLFADIDFKNDKWFKDKNYPERYLKICRDVKSKLNDMNPPFANFYELSNYAFEVTKEKEPKAELAEKSQGNSKIMKNEILKEENKEYKTIASERSKLDKNIILYGPPGTGKTYNTKIYAVAICENNTENNAIESYKQKDYDSITKTYNELVENGRIVFTTFHQSYGYEDFIEGIKAETIDGQVFYRPEDGVFKKLCDEAKKKENIDKNYVLIIDEINRGNISKIFGELITLIEETKRAGENEALEVILPYSKKRFSVPKKIYIIGTMNTADRSIALIDTALRRRFQFIEMMPNAEVLMEMKANEINIDVIADEELKRDLVKNNIEKEIGSEVKLKLDVVEMLKTINKRIEVLYDREHMIGHAYFTKLAGSKPKESMSILSSIFKNKIIPLLQEYFYEDYSKIRLILGDNAKSAQNEKDTFIIRDKVVENELFIGDISDYEFPDYRYKINNDAFNRIQSYIKIYDKDLKETLKKDNN